MTWQLPIRSSEIKSGEVHLWRAFCAPSISLVFTDVESIPAAFGNLLTEAETTRAGRFATATLRRRYLQAHSLLHTLLGLYTHAGSQRCELGYHPQGKPFLIAPQLHPTLEFNLSHSGEMVVIALARGSSVGIDVELIRPLDDLNAMIGVTCSAAEQEYLAGLTTDARLLEFYRLWTRKEAWLKLGGAGLGGSLKSVEVHEEPAAVTLLDLPPADLASGDYVGALALPAGSDALVMNMIEAFWNDQ